MVEFALLAPVFILTFMGIVELGRFCTYGVLAQAAARASANYGAQNLTTAADLAGIDTGLLATHSPSKPIAVTYKDLCSVNGALPPTTCVVSATDAR